MRVTIFEPAISQGGRPAFDAFREGVIALGDTCEYTRNMHADCDVAVHASGIKGGRLKNCKLSSTRQHLIKRYPKSRVVIESPAFRQGLVMDDGVAHYWRVGLNGFLHDEADYANEDSPSDRWERISEEQGINLQPWNTNVGDSFLIMLQKPTDASLRGTDIYDWCQTMIGHVLRISPGADIVVRPHPLERGTVPDFEGARISNDLSAKGLKLDLIRAGAVITFTSLSAIEAICAGKPTWAMDCGSPAYPVANKQIARLGNPWLASEDDVEQWLFNLAYTQWTLEELRSGEPWLRLRERWEDRYEAL